MMVPAQPKIYHIVHVDNLPSIVSDGFLLADSLIGQRKRGAIIGNSEIKASRLNLPVNCHPGTCVGDYVPFYFCPRSVMLYVISKRNHPNVMYRDGQEPIVHLMADLHEAVAWADKANVRWAFTPINAAARAADFYCDLRQLHVLDWRAIRATQWASCRDHKMAEFLMYERFPWFLVRGVGVRSSGVGAQVLAAMPRDHRPPVKVKTGWYYGG